MTRPAERLRELLAEKGWSEKQLSERAGLGHGYVTDALHRGDDWNPRAKAAAALAEALDVDTAYLEGRSNVRRAVGRLHSGPAWGGGADNPELDPITRAVDQAVMTQTGVLRAYHLPPGVTGIDVPAGSTIIVALDSGAESGDRVLVETPDEGVSICYLAEPYIFGTGPDGRAMHRLRTPDTKIIGRVVMILST